MKQVKLDNIVDCFKTMDSNSPSFGQAAKKLFNVEIREQIEFFNLTESEWELLNTPTLTRDLARHTYIAFKKDRRLDDVFFMVMTKDLAFNYDSGTYELVAFGYNKEGALANQHQLSEFFDHKIQVRYELLFDFRSIKK